MKNITFEEIIRRKSDFIQSHPDEELHDVDEGYIKAFTEMLSDMNLPEKEFIAKYSKSVKTHQNLVDSVMDGETAVPDFGKVSGYNNAVMEILSLLDMSFMFE